MTTRARGSGSWKQIKKAYKNVRIEGVKMGGTDKDLFLEFGGENL